jgi:hypothetical protein
MRPRILGTGLGGVEPNHANSSMGATATLCREGLPEGLFLLNEKTMFKITKAQLHGIVLNQHELLLQDIEAHLAQYRPELMLLHPRPYLLGLIRDSIKLASRFNIDDVFSMRLFVRLRWDIAPGFYRQPQIARVLSWEGRTAEDRFKELATERYAQAWEEAQKFNAPQEWRTQHGGSDA